MLYTNASDFIISKMSGGGGDIHIIVHLQYMKTILVFITYSMKKAFFEEFPVWKLGISRSSHIVLP